ncbi:MAG: recombination protein RecR [Clostridia bacterium]|nr:recombination protein RecR [Clostridia bacterium]MBR5992126.1 recombination protein RecR [Clostridia bacterium]MBR6479408.1 recombination protein RecR [Clostridia bacterium]
MSLGYDVAALEELINRFERIPGIGRKSAQRMAFYVLDLDAAEANKFAEAIKNAHESIKQCTVCCNLTENETCSICSNEARNKTIVCVVEDPRDVMAIERTHEYDGLYHVLHGAISPMDGIGPDQLTIKQLLARLDGVEEVIMATNPTVSGEATAMYVSRLLKPLGIKVTRLAYGVPVGADLEYADEVTLTRAMEGRREI